PSSALPDRSGPRLEGRPLELSVKTMLERRPRAVNQELDRPLAAFQPFGDRRHAKLRAIPQIDRFPRRAAQTVQAQRQMPERFFLRPFHFAAQRVKLQTQLRPRHLFSTLSAPHVLAEQVASDS